MAKIKNTTAYPTVIPADDDLLIGTDVNNNNKTVTFKVSDLSGGAPTNQGLNSVLGVGNISALNIELNGSASAIGSSISCIDIFPSSISAGGLGQTGTINQVITANGTGGFTWSDSQGGSLTWQETLTNGNSATSNPVLTGIFEIKDGGTPGVGGLNLSGTTYLSVEGLTTFKNHVTYDDGADVDFSSTSELQVDGVFGSGGQFLAVNSAATGMEWTSNTSKNTPTIEAVLTSGSDTLGQSMEFTGVTTLSLDATSNIVSNGVNTFAGNNTFSAAGTTATTSGIALTGTLWDGTSTGSTGQVLSSFTDVSTGVVSVKWINSSANPTLQEVLNNGNTADSSGINTASITLTGNSSSATSATNGIFTVSDGTINLTGSTSQLMLGLNPGVAGEVLTSAGPNVLPTWGAAGGGGTGTVTSVTGFSFPTPNLTNYVSVITDQATPAPVITTNLITDGTVTGGSLTEFYDGQGSFSVPIGTDWDFELSKALTVVTIKLEDDQATPRSTDFTLTEGSGISLTQSGSDIAIAYTGAGGIDSIQLVSSTLDLTQTLPSTNPLVADGQIDINLANTAVTAGSYTNTSLSVDSFGRITAASSGTEDDTKYELGAGGRIGSSNILLVSGGTGYAVGLAATTTNSATGSGFAINIVNVDGTTGAITATSIGSAGAGYVDGDIITISGGNNDATYTVQNIVNTANILSLSGTDFTDDTVEFLGTGGTTITTAANVITIDSSTGSGMTSWVLTGDSGTNQTVTNGQDVNILGGTFASTAASNDRNVTIDLSATGLSVTPAETSNQALLGDNTWGFVVKTLGVPLIGAVNTSNTTVGAITYTNTTGDSVMTLSTYGGTDLLGLVPLGGVASTVLAGDGTWKGSFQGASVGVDGATGIVPQPQGTGGFADYDKFLKGDGTWATPAGAGTVTSIATTLPITGGIITSTGTIAINDYGGSDGISAGTKGAVPIPAITDNIKFLKGSGGWVAAMDLFKADDGLGVITTYAGSNILEISAGTNVSVASSQAVVASDTVTTLVVSSTDEYTGTVTSVGVASPLVTSLVPSTDPITSTGTISMPAATDTVSGYLTTTDWNTFNDKGDGTVTEVVIGTLDGISGSIDDSTTIPSINLTNIDKGSDQSIFKNIAVTTQTTLVADENADTLTFASSNKIVLTTAVLTDTLTISLDAFDGATAAVSGSIGGVPLPSAGEEGLFLQGDGTWATPAGAGTVTSVSGTLPIVVNNTDPTEPIVFINTFAGSVVSPVASDGTKGAVPAPLIADNLKFLQGTGDWATAIANITVTLPLTKGGTAETPVLAIDTFSGATTILDGTKGAVPAPLIAEKDYFLKGTGVWAAVPGAYTFNLNADAGTLQTINDGDTVLITGGDIISTSVGATDEVTINHAGVTRTDPTVLTPSPGSGGSFTSVSSITASAQGHITAVQFDTVTLPTSDNYQNWTLAGDSGTVQTISTLGAVTIKGGVGCQTFTDPTATGNLTLDVTAFGGATTVLAGTVGGVTAPAAGQENYILNGAGTWIANAIGTVTSVDGSGGSTGLTLTGGAITSSGTLTLGGTLAIANGGTNLTTYTKGDLLYASANDVLASLPIGSEDEVLTVLTGATGYSWQVPTTGSVTSFSSTVAGDALDVNVTNSTSTPAAAFTWAGSAAQYITGQGNLALLSSLPQGTVTSVDSSYVTTGGSAVAGDAAFRATGGPITGAGTLVLTADGAATQYVSGQGKLIDFPTLTDGTVTSIQLSGDAGTPGTAITTSGVFQLDGLTEGDTGTYPAEGTVTDFYNGIEAAADNLKVTFKSFAIPDEPQGWIYKADAGQTTAAGLKRSIIYADDTANSGYSSVAIANGVITKEGYNLVLGTGGSAKGFIYNAGAGSYRWSNVDSAGVNDSSGASVFIGPNAGAAATGCTNTIAIGSSALAASATSSGNIALGTSALAGTSSGANNVAIGTNSLSGNSTGGNNIAIGASALATSSTVSNNIAIGSESLTANLLGTANIGLGANTLLANTNGTKNLAIGVSALAANILASNNVAIGDSALAAQNNVLAVNNTAIGVNALAANTQGECNVAIGKDAQSLQATVQTFNIAIGCQAALNSYGGADIAIGYQALLYGSNSTPNSATNEETGRVAIGYKAQAGAASGTNLIQGVGNVSVGGHSGEFNSTSAVGGAVFLGYYAGNNSTDSSKLNINPIAIGKSAMQSGVTSESIALGFQAMFNSLGGANHIAIGKNALAANANVTGSYNIAIGEGAMNNLNIASDCVAIGRSSATKGLESIAIGLQASAGGLSTSQGAISIGASSGVSASFGVAIGRGATIDGEYSIAIGFGSQAIDDNSVSIGRGASTNGANQFAIGTAAQNVGVTDAVTTFTQSNRWTVKINGVDYYIPLDAV